MRLYLARVLHIILAFAVLLSTTGITINRHFCQNIQVNAAVFFHANSCGACSHKTANNHSGCSKHEKKEENNCCKDKSEYHKLEQSKELTVPQFKPLDPESVSILTWLPSIFANPSSRNGLESCLPPYHRPFIRGNLQVWLQVFRF